MLDVEGKIIEEDFDWFNKFTCDEGQLISRVRVGKFMEEQISRERPVYIDIYKLADGFILWNEWDFSSNYTDTPEQVQEIIEEMQDRWLELSDHFAHF